MKKLALIIPFLITCMPVFAHGGPERCCIGGEPRVFAISSGALEKNKWLIIAKDPTIMNAYKQLLKDAKKAMEFGPVSVMSKTNNPPSGNKHDYMSLAPYFWPDPSKPNGIPYMRKDGETNPEVKDYKDKDYMPKLCENVHILGLAYYFSGDESYAAYASKLLRVWFLDTATRMNPNLNYAQAIKGVNEGRGAGLIDTRHFIKVIDGIGLLQGSRDWKPKDQKGMQIWFAQFLNWMETSKNGKDEMDAQNNHGAWYDAQRLSMALFTDDNDAVKKIIINAENRLDKQMDDAGMFPKEMERTISLHYTNFAIEAFFNIAQMAEHAGRDFWNYTSPSGKSLRKAFYSIHPYIIKEKQWAGQQIKDFEYEEGYQLLLQAASHFDCKKCASEVATIAGDDAAKLRVTLLY
jgi:hypothetical protein